MQPRFIKKKVIVAIDEIISHDFLAPDRRSPSCPKTVVAGVTRCNSPFGALISIISILLFFNEIQFQFFQVLKNRFISRSILSAPQNCLLGPWLHLSYFIYCMLNINNEKLLKYHVMLVNIENLE